jgi:hypothetical protein
MQLPQRSPENQIEQVRADEILEDEILRSPTSFSGGNKRRIREQPFGNRPFCPVRGFANLPGTAENLDQISGFLKDFGEIFWIISYHFSRSIIVL